MGEHGFRSFREQSAHYFLERPHDRAVVERIECPAAWVGRELPPLAELAETLTADQVDEIDRALAVAKRSPREGRDLRREDFPLPGLAARIDAWRGAVAKGIGFQVLRGLPVDCWTQEEAELFFWGLGLHLGSPGAQNPRGDLLGHVTDTGAREHDPMVRLYQTSADIRFHCDAADAVGLLCLRRAKRGGASRVASSVTIFNELVERRPELVPRLFEPFFLDLRGETADDTGSCIAIPPCRHADGRLRTFYHADYFRSAVRHDEVPPFTEDELALLDTYESIANEPGIYFDMDLEPGDVQLLSNHTNVHARTGYEDPRVPAERRHLLRLWLSL